MTLFDFNFFSDFTFSDFFFLFLTFLTTVLTFHFVSVPSFCAKTFLFLLFILFSLLLSSIFFFLDLLHSYLDIPNNHRIQSRHLSLCPRDLSSCSTSVTYPTWKDATDKLLAVVETSEIERKIIELALLQPR